MHTTQSQHVCGGSVMLAVPPALLDILHLQPGAKVGIAVESGRLVVEPQQRPRYTLDELLAQCDPKARRSKKSASGRVPSRPAASSSDEARRNLARQSRSYVGTRAKGPPSGADRVAGGLQPDDETPRSSADHERRNFARTAGFAVPLTGAGTKTTGVVRCDQPRAFGSAARRGRKLESVPVRSWTRCWRSWRRFLSDEKRSGRSCRNQHPRPRGLWRCGSSAGDHNLSRSASASFV